jgi:hypothetical protein
MPEGAVCPKMPDDFTTTRLRKRQCESALRQKESE